MHRPDFIQSPEALDELIDRLGNPSFLAVDTEFVRERTYYPELCVVQVACDTVVACVDTLAIDDLTPLWRLLLDTSTVKILHAARQDLEIFFQVCGQVPTPVFDTQIAAGFVGRGSQTGYAALVADMLGERLDKTQTRTNWARRPLTEDQLNYAAADVEYLVTVYHRLEEELRSLGRAAWAEDEFAAIVDERLYRPDPEGSWKRIKGAGRLGGRSLGALRKLGAWRERRAMRLNRPRQWVLKDAALLEIARCAPVTQSDLAGIDGVPPAVVMKEGARILECCAGATTDETADKPAAYEPLTSEQKSSLDRLMTSVRERSAESGVSPELISTRRELERLVRGERDLAILSGWRRTLLGTDLLDTLENVAPAE